MVRHQVNVGLREIRAWLQLHSSVKDLFDRFGPTLVLLLMLAIFSVSNPFFGKFDNLMLIVQEAATIAIVAAGQTLVILTGGIDLAVGSLVGLTGVFAAGLMKRGLGPIPPINSYLALVIGLLIGTLAGLSHGLLITRVKIPPFIVTLGTLSAFKGLALVYTRASPIHLLPDDFKWISDAYLWRIPMPAVIMFIVYFLCWLLLNFATFGRHIYAIGGNEPAARLTGIDVKKVKLYVYSLCGLLSGVAGMILIARLDGGIYTNGEGYELNAIAGVVIGGTSLMGGQGSIWGTIVGVLIMSTVNNALVMYNVPPEWNKVVTGTIIIAAVMIDLLRTRTHQD